MGLSMSSLWALWSSPKEVRVCMIGLDAAGKTCMNTRLALGETQETTPTIGFTVQTVEYKTLKFNIFDVGGQKRLQSLWKHYYENCGAVIFVVDSNDRERIGDAASALHEALSDPNLARASLLVFANKQDLPNAMSVSQVADGLNLKQLGAGRKYFIQGSTATTGKGVYEGLDWLAANLPAELPPSGDNSE